MIASSDALPLWDFFISHAHEDKTGIATPLAESLRDRGFEVWFDDFTLTLGDSLREKIDFGIARSKYGIVILSPNFLAKSWTQRELNALIASETTAKKLLPIWHQLDVDKVRQYSPLLADRLAINSSKGIDAIINELIRATNMTPRAIAAPALRVVLPATSLATIFAYSQRGYPEIVGGFLIGKASNDQTIVLEGVIEAPNAASPDERRSRYTSTPLKWVEVEDIADDLKVKIVGYFISSPDAPAAMSQFDLDHSLPNMIYLKTSVQNGQARDVKAWRLRDDRSKFDSMELVQV